MNKNDPPSNLSELLDCVLKEHEADDITLRDIFDTLGTGSYGPALLLVSFISMLPPISLIPGLPVVTGAVILLLSIQLLFLRPQPWLPDRFLLVSFSREKMASVSERWRPWAKRLAKIVGPRMSFLLVPPLLNAIAVICIALALLIFTLAVLPGGENVPAAGVLFFGLALTAQDGLLALVGIALTGVSIWLIVHFWNVVAQSIWQAV